MRKPLELRRKYYNNQASEHSVALEHRSTRRSTRGQGELLFHSLNGYALSSVAAGDVHVRVEVLLTDPVPLTR
jgi:hypothetical protein